MPTNMNGMQRGAPTPWWQLPGQQQASTNLEQSAPNGYTYDKVQMRYVPTGQSAGHTFARQQKAESDMDSLLAGLKNYAGTSSMTSSGSGYTPTQYAPVSNPIPRAEYQPTNGPDVGALAAEAENAAMGKAKATAGSLGRSSLESLRSQLAERGILGSGVEARGTVDRLAAATNPLSDVNLASLKEQIGIAEHNKDLGFQAANQRY